MSPLEPEEARTSRRMFLAGTGVVAAGLLVPWIAQRRRFAGDAVAGGHGAPRPGLAPNAFVHIAPDDTITIWIGKAEMGQGVYTTLPQILAEELDVDPRRVTVEFAPVDKAFNHPQVPMQFTGGSMSTSSSYESLRRAGATARWMLVAAAARRFSVNADEIRTENGIAQSAAGAASYGELAVDANRIAPPREVPLKDPSQFRYIGKPLRRLDGEVKVTGRAQFGIDVVRPGMVHASIARPPGFGARVRGVDDRDARAVAGVLDVVQVPAGVAVVATNTWAAQQGREALHIDWDDGPNAGFTTEALRTQYRALLATPGVVAGSKGDVSAGLAGATRSIDVEYEVPFLAHASMEPLNCVAQVQDGRCEIWTGSQFQSEDRIAAAKALGIDPSKVELHTTFLGGGFGRRANPYSDFVVEAVELAKAIGKPVKVTWSREDDMRGGWYRPFAMSRVRAGVDAGGLPVAWHHTIAAQSVLADSPFRIFTHEGRDPTVFEGASEVPYAIPNFLVDVHQTSSPVTVQWWRSVGHPHTAFVVNGVIEELAALGGRDPVTLRRALMREKPRHLAVFDAVVSRVRSVPREPGRHVGYALQESFGSIVAQAAEVSVQRGRLRVHRLTCAIDCGFAVNPAGLIAQMESGIVYGLSAALHGEISIEKGRPVQSNFHDYPVLRMNEMPFIDTIIVPSTGPMGGGGEPATPPVAPALCAAIYAATGQRIRKLPIVLGS